MTRTFVYTGPANAIRVLGEELQKGQPFFTSDPMLIERLSLLVEVEEVKKEDLKPRSSRKNDAVKS